MSVAVLADVIVVGGDLASGPMPVVTSAEGLNVVRGAAARAARPVGHGAC